MTPQNIDLPPFVRGDTFAIPVNFTQGGNPANRSGWVLWFTVKNSPHQSDEDALIQKNFAVSGTEVVVPLLKEDTQSLPAATYHYDLQLVSASGDVVQTLVMGKLKLIAGITDRTE
ncbi:hypothetical protein [Endozoicomonas arenosclerae]|uniref:hypothetical protein n=1 Tax=Endozoicomonas arenosclerae TaxID=1633495 RepID=UPI000785EEB9|nr:hypothetical protein [Endozoicomonas arenosclerae]